MTNPNSGVQASGTSRASMKEAIDAFRQTGLESIRMNNFKSLDRATAAYVLDYLDEIGLPLENEIEVRAYYRLAPRGAGAARVLVAAVPLWVRAGLVVGAGLLLACLAFGVSDVFATLGLAAYAVSLGFTPQGGRLLAFTAFGLLSLFSVVSVYVYVTSRYSVAAIGGTFAFAALVVALYLLGMVVLHVGKFDVGTLTLLWSGCAVVFLIGGNAALNDVTARTVAQQGRTYLRKGDTIHGDARAADDWEVDEALRDKRGGFNPMFKD